MKHILFLPLIASCVIFLGFSNHLSDPATVPQQQTPTDHRFIIGKLGNSWKVYSSLDSTNRIIQANPGDRVIWTASGSELFFQFPDESIFNSSGATLANGNELTLTVSMNAKAGEYTYSVFCTMDNQFATGDSPPKIIIK